MGEADGVWDTAVAVTVREVETWRVVRRGAGMAGPDQLGKVTVRIVMQGKPPQG